MIFGINSPHYFLQYRILSPLDIEHFVLIKGPSIFLTDKNSSAIHRTH